MKKILILILLLNANFAISQMREAKIFFNDSTSVEGFGEIKKNKIYFKVEKKDEPSEWSFDITKGITFSSYGYSEKYEYVKISKNKKPLLLQIIEEGDVTLYLDILIENQLFRNFNSTTNPISQQMQNNSYQTFGESEIRNVYYAKRKNEELATNITANFSKNTPKYFEDCGALVQKIKTKKFLKKDIEEIVTYYNNYCNDENDQDASR